MEPKYVYQVRKGNNVFCLGGRVVFGPDIGFLLLAIFFILVPAVVFGATVAKHLMDDLSHYIGVAIMVGFVVCTLFVLVLLLMTAGSDPGIMPRNLDRIPDSPPHREHVNVNGVDVALKFCNTCKIYKPPRCVHCHYCNNCVEHFDHHCPWLGQCIGQRNYRTFFAFISSTWLLCIFVFAMCVFYIKVLMDEKGHIPLWRVLVKTPASIFLMVYTFIAGWFVGVLTLLHIYLISSNQTSLEYFRSIRKDNQYNKGILLNFQEILCNSIPPSKIKFRDKVRQELTNV